MAAAQIYGSLRSELEADGKRLAEPDFHIASSVLASELTLITTTSVASVGTRFPIRELVRRLTLSAGGRRRVETPGRWMPIEPLPDLIGLGEWGERVRHRRLWTRWTSSQPSGTKAA